MRRAYIRASFWLVLFLLFGYSAWAESHSLLDQRRGEFIKRLRAFSSTEARIDESIRIARDRSSDLRNIAIDYLVSRRAKKFESTALVLIQDEPVLRGILLYFRKVPSETAVPPLIEMLDKAIRVDQDPGLQDDIVFTLRVISGEQFTFSSYHSKSDREREMGQIKEWWQKKTASTNPAPSGGESGGKIRLEPVSK